MRGCWELTTFGALPIGCPFAWSDTASEPGEVWLRRKVADGLYRRPAQQGHRELLITAAPDQVVYRARSGAGDGV